jgi:hypothetical protein
MREYVRNQRGEPIAYFTRNGRHIVYLWTMGGKRLGQYDSDSNVTQDANGRWIGQGNLLLTLLTR